LQPHEPPQHPPPEDGAELPEEDPPEDFVPFDGAAKTESWIVFFVLAHFGHVIFVFPFITMRS
jgi:hypothetical protein